jgi:hypothetical protein
MYGLTLGVKSNHFSKEDLRLRREPQKPQATLGTVKNASEQKKNMYNRRLCDGKLAFSSAELGFMFTLGLTKDVNEYYRKFDIRVLRTRLSCDTG